MSATVARADAPPATGQAAAPANQTSNPYWNAPSGPLGDLPAADIRVVPAAGAQAVRTRWVFNQGLVDLSNAVRVARMTMDRHPEYKKAVDDEKAAYDVMESSRVAALADLKNNPAYAGANTLHRNVSAQIADEQAARKPDETRLAAMAKLKLQYVRDNRKLESAALERDANYQDARRKYVDAAKRTADFRDAQAMAIATDASLTGLRKNVADARIEKLAAIEFYRESLTARELALDYALRHRRVDTYHGYGNGYGYGSGYGNYGYGFGSFGGGLR